MKLSETIRHRPTREELSDAADKVVADIIEPGLRLLFCGINPGLYSAAIGHHFGRPGNRFWPTIYNAGITPRLLSPYEERELLIYGCGITNVVNRTTPSAKEITNGEMIAGGKELIRKVLQYQPRVLALLGVTAYRTAFNRPHAQIGLQNDMIGAVTLWILPNTSGLNAHYQLDRLAILFQEMNEFASSHG